MHTIKNLKADIPFFFFKVIIMNLGITIKKLRKQRGYKQNMFANKCFITPSYLSQIENNIREPNISTLNVIAENLKVPLPILFFLSMEQVDIPLNKRESFEKLGPFVQSLIQDFFTDTADKQ